MTTQAVIQINGFNEPLSNFCSPEFLSGLAINDAESEAEVMMLASGETVTRSMLKASEPQEMTVYSNSLKIKDSVQHAALSKSGDIGSGAVITVGLESVTYNKVTVISPLKTLGNSGSENSVTLVFSGSGKR